MYVICFFPFLCITPSIVSLMCVVCLYLSTGASCSACMPSCLYITLLPCFTPSFTWLFCTWPLFSFWFCINRAPFLHPLNICMNVETSSVREDTNFIGTPVRSPAYSVENEMERRCKDSVRSYPRSRLHSIGDRQCAFFKREIETAHT